MVVVDDFLKATMFLPFLPFFLLVDTWVNISGKNSAEVSVRVHQRYIVIVCIQGLVDRSNRLISADSSGGGDGISSQTEPTTWTRPIPAFRHVRVRDGATPRHPVETTGVHNDLERNTMQSTCGGNGIFYNNSSGASGVRALKTYSFDAAR